MGDRLQALLSCTDGRQQCMHVISSPPGEVLWFAVNSISHQHVSVDVASSPLALLGSILGPQSRLGDLITNPTSLAQHVFSM